MPRLYFIFSCVVAISLSACAQQPSPPLATTELPITPSMPHNKDEREMQGAQAQKLRADAAALKIEAAAKHEQANAACWKKFLVSSCLDDARQTFRQEESRARQMEREAKLIERNIRSFDAAEDAAKRAADNARRDAKAAAKGKTPPPVEVSQ